jgi:Na+/proline symporter
VPGALSSLTWPDYAVVAGALAVLLAIGFVFARAQHDTADFFLARRRVPWWAACLSFLATEISAVTIISVPATAYSENWEYAQFFVGSSLAKLAVAFLFIPAFYRHNVTTIYEFLAYRFGQRSQVTGSIFFFVTRLAGSGARLTLTAVAVGYLMGWSLIPTIVVFSIVSILYIATGGVQAVVWTNVFQALMFLLAGAITLAYLISEVSGGLGTVVATAGAAGRLNVIEWGPSITSPDFWSSALTKPNIVWVALLNGLFGSMAAFGTDHDLMQRLLTVETRGESQRTLALTPIGTFVTLLIYLGLGAGLFTYYTHGHAPRAARPDAGGHRAVVRRLAARLPGCLVRDRHLPAAARPEPLGAALSRGLALGGAHLRRRAGRPGLGVCLRAGPDAVDRVQDRRGDLGLAPRGLPARAPEPPRGE